MGWLAWAGWPYFVSRPVAVTRGLAAVAVGLAVSGATLPTWGPRAGLPALYRWAGRYRAYRRLAPLWLDLYRAYPQIALLPPSRVAERLPLRDLDFRLYRRVVEIRDGCLALRPYREPRAAQVARELCRATGIADDERRVIVEATSLAAALQAKARGRPPHQTPPTLPLLGGADIHSEVATLERLARCYRRSPLVRAALMRLDDNAGSDSAHTERPAGGA